MLSRSAHLRGVSQRLVAAMACDLKLALRNGFFLAAALISVAHLLLLWWIKAMLADWIIALVLLEIFIFNGFYFAAALVLLQKAENTLLAQQLTPLRHGEGVLGRCAVLSLLAVFESLLVAAPLWPINPMLLVASALLITSILCQLGLVMVLRYQSLSEFLMPSSLAFVLLLVPALELADVWSSPWLMLHPLTPGIKLLKASVSSGVDPASAAGWLVAAAAWLIPTHWLAARATRNMALAT